jgi:hypothetical protein
VLGSLNENGELGLILGAPSVLPGIARVFATDFAKGTHPH